MPEVKNSFIASRMNKNLDDRLLPSNEYRNAVNVAVSESEDSDVGALENVIGNLFLTKLVVPGGSNTECIGAFTDDASDSIYLFLTDFTDTSPSELTQRPEGAVAPINTCAIVRFNTGISPPNYEVLVIGSFLNFSTTHPIYGINLIEDLLFWTDNRNQPRKINVNEIFGSYVNEDSISVAKYAPWEPISLVKETSTPGIYEGTMVDASSPGAIGSTVGIATNPVVANTDVSVQVIQGEFEVGDIVNGDGIPVGTTISNISGVNNEVLELSQNVDIEKGGNVLVGLANPNYIENYAGDPNFLQDKFVRFSYRFKFVDNEYSIMAPFTQSAFIPNQDGYFLEGDEERTWLSSEVSFMDNKVDLIDLIIPLPTSGENLKAFFKIKEIDIIYKESDSLSLKVVDTISIDEIENSSGSNNFYEYNYQSTKPILTLPSSEITRVYDKTPVRALSQEVSGNRVIYGNFVNKHTAPESLSYQVTATQKTESGTSYAGLDKEYPYHTLKRNRNYQVGIVLSDRYGRQSDVILSSSVVNNTSNDIYGASTFYWPYRDLTSFNQVEDDNGNSIKILFEDVISSNYQPLTPLLPNQSGEPGLYSSSNPTGWYSYKVVVKQTEQEYYNVYNPGIFLGDVVSPGVTTSANLAYTTLISDNINKVPKDLQDVSADQAQFNSDTKLFCVVNTPNSPLPLPIIPGYNTQGYPLDKQNVISTISTLEDFGATAADFDSILQANSNPYICKIQTPFSLGKKMNDLETDFSLGVFETDPVLSNLDIYYETSTTGLISELNTRILNDLGDVPNDFTPLGYDHFENQIWDGVGTGTGQQNSPYITDVFVPVNEAGTQIISSEVALFRALSNAGVQRAFEQNGVSPPGIQDFQLERVLVGSTTNGYRIKILNPFYYGPNAQNLEAYNFEFQVRNTGQNSSGDVNGAVSSSTSITVDNVSSELFVSMEVFDGSNFIGTIQSISVQDIGAGTATFSLSNVVSLSDGASITFRAALITVFESGALQNSAPIIDQASLTPVNNPEYSTMPTPYFNLTGKNGSADVAKDQQDLVWSFTDETLNHYPYSYLTVGDDIKTQVTFNLHVETGVLGYGNPPALNGDLKQTYVLNVTLRDVSLSDTEDVTILGTPGAFTNGFTTAFDI